MGMQQAVSTCFSKYVTFQGRAKRSEFWWFQLFFWIVMLVLIGGAVIMGDSAIPGILMGLLCLAYILPGVAVTVRRLHDLDRSGWWYFIQLVPVIGGFWLLYLMVIGGTPGPNRYGE